jgi:S-adenosylmethionine:tRNA ribosyltransferase-isomerase
MKLSEFDYNLPKELIAQYPVKERQKCRLMVLDRKTHSITHKSFEDIVGYFNKGDLLVLNDTKVIPARLFGRRKTGGKVELFLLEKRNPICEAIKGRREDNARIRR